MQCRRCGGRANRAGTKVYVESGKHQMYLCPHCGHHFKGELINKIHIRRIS